MRRIQTTHVGSLPRSQPVVDLICAQEEGEAVDDDTFDDMTAVAAINACAVRQVGVDIVSDGEMTRISFATDF